MAQPNSYLGCHVTMVGNTSPLVHALINNNVTIYFIPGTMNRASPSRCGAQCKTWAWGPMQDLSAGPLWAVILWRHRVTIAVERKYAVQH